MEKKYKLHMDTIGFAEKPSKEGEGAIKKLNPRTSHNIVEVTKQELVCKLSGGYSIIPGLCDMSNRGEYEGAKQKDYIQNDFFCLDFDNGKYSKDEVIKIFKDMGIPVFLTHDTYNSSKECEKFHIFFCSTQTILDRNIRDKFQAIIMSSFCDGVDVKCYNRNRYFNGTNKEPYYIDYNAEVDVYAVVEKYWVGSKEQMKFVPRDSELFEVDKASGSKTEPSKERISTHRQRKVHELIPEENFEDAIPKVKNGLLKYNMQQKYEEYMEFINEELETKVFVDGTGRKALIFDVFNMASFSLGSREAYKLCKKINENFEEPLSNKDFNYCTWSAYTHEEVVCNDLHDTHYAYTYETLLERRKVGDDVKKSLAYFRNKEQKDHANIYREPKAERDEYIKELKEQGLGCKRIHKAIVARYGYDEELCLTLDGVKYVIRKLSKGGSFGTIYNSNNIYILPSEELDDVVVENNEEEIENPSECNEEPLNEQQQYAYNIAMLCRNLALIARGGCGKTYVIRKVINALRAQGRCVGCCAATGLAAQNLDNGKTVHNMFGIISNESIEDYYVNIMVAHNLLDYAAIVIDEVGMLDSETFTKVTKAIKYMEIAYNHHIQLIIAGDPLQLESVKGSYFFESPEYNAMGFEEVILDKNMRQSNRIYDKLLSNLREGKDIHNTISHLNFIYNHEEDEEAMYVYAHKLRAIQKNNEVLATLPGEEIRLDAYLSVKIGAKVIVTTNARPNRYGMIKYYNGMQGTIKEVKANSVIVEKMDGSLVTIKRQHITLDENNSYEGYPLALGYALTIHKVQGMTLDSLNIHPSCFASGQLYTALSRVKTPRGVHLLGPIKDKDVKVNRRALRFISDCSKTEVMAM